MTRRAWNSTLPAPTEPMKRSTPLRPVNAKRRKERFGAAFHSEERVLWIQMLPSVVDGARPCENAHVKSRAAGGTYRDIVPLTGPQHRELHWIGKASFEEKYGVDLEEWAARIEALWEAREP